ncbi:unnamed protein product [Ectocarpus sp. 6 AP-2014]
MSNNGQGQPALGQHQGPPLAVAQLPGAPHAPPPQQGEGAGAGAGGTLQQCQQATRIPVEHNFNKDRSGLWNERNKRRSSALGSRITEHQHFEGVPWHVDHVGKRESQGKLGTVAMRRRRRR